MRMSGLLSLFGVGSALVLAMFGVFGWGKKEPEIEPDTPLDTEYMATKFRMGFNSISSAYERQTNPIVDPNISIEDLELAYKIRKAVDPDEAAPPKDRGGGW